MIRGKRAKLGLVVYLIFNLLTYEQASYFSLTIRADREFISAINFLFCAVTLSCQVFAPCEREKFSFKLPLLSM